MNYACHRHFPMITSFLLFLQWFPSRITKNWVNKTPKKRISMPPSLSLPPAGSVVHVTRDIMNDNDRLPHYRPTLYCRELSSIHLEPPCHTVQYLPCSPPSVYLISPPLATCFLGSLGSYLLRAVLAHHFLGPNLNRYLLNLIFPASQSRYV